MLLAAVSSHFTVYNEIAPDLQSTPNPTPAVAQTLHESLSGKGACTVLKVVEHSLVAMCASQLYHQHQNDPDLKIKTFNLAEIVGVQAT